MAMPANRPTMAPGAAQFRTHPQSQVQGFQSGLGATRMSSQPTLLPGRPAVQKGVPIGMQTGPAPKSGTLIVPTAPNSQQTPAGMARSISVPSPIFSSPGSTAFSPDVALAAAFQVESPQVRVASGAQTQIVRDAPAIQVLQKGIPIGETVTTSIFNSNLSARLNALDTEVLNLQLDASPQPVTQHVFFKGTRIPHYETHQLRTLPPTVLKLHAAHVYETLGSSVIETPMPEHEHLLVEWLTEVHRIHLGPLLPQSALSAMPLTQSGAPSSVIPQSALPSTIARNSNVMHAGEHALQHVHFDGVHMPLYEVQHLRTLPMTVIRAHAQHMHKTIGPSLLCKVMPVNEEHLIDWITEVQAVHLHPLRSQAPQHAVPHVYHRGVPLPLYEKHQLQSLPVSYLRLHANHFSRVIGTGSRPVPEHDHLLLDWLFDMHRTHLDDHLTRVTRTHTVPHAVCIVHLQGVPVPLYEEAHLRSLPLAILRAHVDHVLTAVGSEFLRSSMPMNEAHLVEWLLDVHNAHLEPLRAQAMPHVVPHVFYRGIPLPLYEKHHFEVLSRRHLRAHANHLYKTIGVIPKPVPEEDHLLLEWLLEMHRIYLHHHLVALRGDVVIDEKRKQISVQEELLKLRELQAMTEEEVQVVLMKSMLAHGFKASAKSMRQESKIDFKWDELWPDGGDPFVEPGMSDESIRHYNEYRQKDVAHEYMLKDSSGQVGTHGARLDKLFERMQVLNRFVEAPSKEQAQASSILKRQQDKMETLRLSQEALESLTIQLSSDIEQQQLLSLEVCDAIEARRQNVDLYKSQAERLEEKIAELRKIQDEGNVGNESDTNRANRIRKILLQWDAPHGAKRLAAETFAKVDSNHDGRLEYEEVLKFVRIIFTHHNLPHPPWPESVWSALYLHCSGLERGGSPMCVLAAQTFQGGVARPVDVAESLRFTRGCFEATLRYYAYD